RVRRLISPFIGRSRALGGATAADPARQVANAHTFFNLGISLLFLPFTPVAGRVIETLVPDDQREDTPFRTKYLDERGLEQPSLALGQAHREALRTADVVQGMLRDALPAFRSDNLAMIETRGQRDDRLACLTC